jgi:hypothetical protein
MGHLRALTNFDTLLQAVSFTLPCRYHYLKRYRCYDRERYCYRYHDHVHDFDGYHDCYHDHDHDCGQDRSRS